MSSGGCSCGLGCKCGGNCSCSMYPDVEKSPTVSFVEGVAPVMMYTEGSFSSEGGHGCKCGSNCNCDPCNC